MNEKASGAQAIEQRAHEMLLTAYGSGPLEVFGNADQPDEQKGERLATAKAAADLLVNSRFAKYADEGRTQIELTNAGRYWALNGGFLAFLKEEPAGRGGARGRNPEMEALRMDYMRLRLGTFWWSFGFSLTSFVFALLSLAIAFFYGDRLMR
jgi:hypothetical protein